MKSRRSLFNHLREKLCPYIHENPKLVGSYRSPWIENTSCGAGGE
jgi:hypothetical protein